MGKLRIGFDCDGVLADYTGAFRMLIRRHLGIDTDANEQLSWNFTSLGISPEQEDHVFKASKAFRNFWLSVDPLPNTGLLTMRQEEFTPIFITNRYESAGFPVEHQTAQWLIEYFDINYPTVIVAKNKGEVCRALKLDAYIDDNVPNCQDIMQNAPDTRIFMQLQSYNRNFFSPSITRIDSVNSYLERILNGNTDDSTVTLAEAA